MSEWLSLIKPPFGVPINRNHQLAQGLVASYLMNEGCGDLVHDSCEMNDGKLIGAAPMSPTSGWVSGPHGPALAFDGGDDYVDCGKLLDNATKLSISLSVLPNAIFKAPGDTTRRVAIGKYADTNNRLQLFYSVSSPDNVMYFVSRNGGVNNDLSQSLSLWSSELYHIVYVFDGIGATSVYKNGLQILTRTSAITSIPATNNFYIGQVGTYFFNGLISSVSIYNRALSAEEIAYLYAFPWCMYEDVQYRHKVSLCKYAA